MASRKKIILFLAANPKNYTTLDLAGEVRAIEQGLVERAKYRNKFQFEQRWATTVRDMGRAILDLNPQIVHFSGHGTGENGLAFEDETGQVKLVPAKAL